MNEQADLGGAPAAPQATAPAATSAGAVESRSVADPVAAALARAEKIVAERHSNLPADGEQAAGTPGASTPQTESGTQPPATAAATSAPKPGAAQDLATSATADSTAPPASWPAELKTQFEQLPKEGPSRGIVLQIQKSMQGGFTQAMQAMKARQQELDGLVQFDRYVQENPKDAIAKLAQQVGVDVFFEPPTAETDGPPEFSTAAEMAEWAKNQALKEFESRRQEEQDARAREQSTAAFQQELQQAATKYPDFRAHGDAIMQSLQDHPTLPVEAAYQLATYATLAAEVAKGREAVAELAKLRGQFRNTRAGLMRPAGGGAGDAAPTTAKTLAPAESALARAQAQVDKRWADGQPN